MNQQWQQFWWSYFWFRIFFSTFRQPQPVIGGAEPTLGKAFQTLKREEADNSVLVSHYIAMHGSQRELHTTRTFASLSKTKIQLML